MAAKICFNCTYEPNNLKNRHDLHSALQKTIKIIAESEGYVNYIVVERQLNTDGGNYLGELSEIDIKGTTGNGEKEISLFIKKQIHLEKIKIFNINEVYLKELYFYTDLSKVITHLQETAKIPTKDRFKIAKAYDGSNAECLIFENLTRKGFKTYGRLDLPDLKYIELAVAELAKFHGISFAMEYKMPEFYKNNIKTVHNPLSFDDDWDGFVENAFLYTANLFGGEIKRKIKDFLPIAIKKFPMYEYDQTTVKCCLTHNDYRLNNILVREIDGVPVEVFTVDFQLIAYGCPLKDFLFFIFSSTSREFRTRHLDNLKEMYFETLTRYLKYFDLDVEDVYPKKEFEEVYKEWLDYGLMKMLFASVFLFGPETGLDITNQSLAELPINPDKEFEERARGLIEDFIEWGYL